MAIDATHPSYDKFAGAWEMVRDCLGGARRMRSRASKYIPLLYKQKPEEYSAMVKRAVFFNACKRTLQAMVGFVFRQNPDIKTDGGEESEAFLQDATMSGKTFYDYAKEMVGEALSVGRGATLIDWNMAEDRPYVVRYETEAITDWRFGRVNKRTVLTGLVLEECVREVMRGMYEATGEESFSGTEQTQWRVFELIEEDPDYVENPSVFLRMRVYRRKIAPVEGGERKKPKVAQDNTSRFDIIDEQYPERKGGALMEIPVVFHGAEENSVEPTVVPLEDIAEINVAHWRNSADYENALHMAGVPTPIAVGFESTEENPREFILGSTHAWVTDKANANAFFLSYNAAQAAPLKEAMETKEKQMAALGARMLEQQGGWQRAGGVRDRATAAKRRFQRADDGDDR